jgi:hypothetical protein
MVKYGVGFLTHGIDILLGHKWSMTGIFNEALKIPVDQW